MSGQDSGRDRQVPLTQTKDQSMEKTERDRIEDLEVMVEHQARLLDDLNEVVIEQGKIISDLRRKIEIAGKRIVELEDLSPGQVPVDKPPHW